MYNPELFEKMVEKFGMNKTIEFAEMVTYMYNLLHQDALSRKQHNQTEYGYEHYWWEKKHEELKSVKQS